MMITNRIPRAATVALVLLGLSVGLAPRAASAACSGWTGFPDGSDFLPVGTRPTSVVMGDVTGDGKPDMVVANNGSGTVSVLVGLGGGKFAPKVDYACNGARAVAIADVTGDGMLDLVAVTSTNKASVFVNQGAGTFAAKVDYATGTDPRSVVAADLTGDGKADLAVLNNASLTVSVLVNQGAGTFAAKVDYPTGTDPRSVVAGDVTGDGKADLAVTNYGSNTVSVFVNVTVHPCRRGRE
jgi:hypothetical protein